MGIGRFLSRLAGSARVAVGVNRPALPTGTRAFVSMEDVAGASWRIRYAKPNEDPTSDRPLVPMSPPFTDQVLAYKYAAWVNGEAKTFEYPAGKV